MLLQIMEEGRLTDSFGRHIDFRNVILILTSNLGSHLMKAGATLGFATGRAGAQRRGPQQEAPSADIMFEVERHFRPEFLNRLDEVLIFNPLTRDDIKRIVHLQLKEVTDRVEAQGMKVEVGEDALDFLMTKGFHEDYGARPMRRAIERYIEDPLAESLLRGEFDLDRPVKASLIGPVEEAEGLSFSQPEAEPGETVEASAQAGDE